METKENLIDKILEFWFGRLEEGFTMENRGKLWYVGGKGVDDGIKKKFGNLVEKATKRELDSWKETAKGRLALIILLDQFTRNIYRKTQEAFASDSYAQELCKQGLQIGQDKELLFIHRLFFYHPLEHSENLEDQELCVKLFQEVMEEVPEEYKKRVKSFLDYAKQHRSIIKQFGRFPHRNEILERESTKQEIKYLKKGHRFGQ